jgi:hypothetical protein
MNARQEVVAKIKRYSRRERIEASREPGRKRAASI